MAESESPDQLPAVDALQFRRAEPVVASESPSAQSCAACKQLIIGQHYQVQNQVICPSCAAKIRAGQQSQRPVPLFRPVIYGVGAAIAGCILYAIPLALGFQIGIVALVVGYMVGKAIRHASYGTGGRAQQVLAVALTYLAISASIVPAVFFIGIKQGAAARSTAKNQPVKPPVIQPVKPMPSPGKLAAGIALLAIVSPFLQLKTSPVGGLISLFILFIGLQRAWVLTARHEIIVAGPYSLPPPFIKESVLIAGHRSKNPRSVARRAIV
jgi:hypothetical protein